MSMEAGNPSAPAGSRSGGGGASADSYIGSLISLTSKSEIRYEGILYSINTEEASIGLSNVRSFGTEGRKKDGTQLPASDKIYEFILFKGSDIKDLQVKASPPVQATPSINSDPAIIQSHYPRPAAPPTAPTVPSGPFSNHGAHSAPVGLTGSSFQSGLPLYQPGGNLNSWDPSSNANGSGLAMPMYWQGFYGTPNLPQLPQQSVLRPPPGLLVPPMQQMQFSGFNSSLPTAGASLPSSNVSDLHSNLAYDVASSSTATSTLHGSNVSLNMAPLQHASSTSETMINQLPNKAPISANFTSTPSSFLPSLSHLPTPGPDNAGLPPISSKPSPIAGPTSLPQPAISQPGTSMSRAAGSAFTESPMPSLVTPGQLLYVRPAPVSAPHPLPIVEKDVEVVQASSGPSSEPSIQEVKEAQPPILPLPSSSRSQPNGGAYHAQNDYRGHGGRGSVVLQPVTNFTEEFDFMAMNEKFNKDEVWGYLGKSNKSQPTDDNGNGSGGDDYLNEHEDELPNTEMKPVYNKDDFFDSLSCNALNNNPRHGRTRYSEQMKLDTETFGDFPRYRGGRGRGGARFRGSYHGRGGYGGYGYAGRGRGRGMQNHLS